MLMPQTVFIDRTGVIRAQFAGGYPGLLNDVQDKTLRDIKDAHGRKKKGQMANRPSPRESKDKVLSY